MKAEAFCDDASVPLEDSPGSYVNGSKSGGGTMGNEGPMNGVAVDV